MTLHGTAYLGGSLTVRPVMGLTAADTFMWPVYDIGKGTIARWTDPATGYWAKFDAVHRDNPIDQVWMMGCTHDQDYGLSVPTLRTQWAKWYDQLRTRTAAPVYVTSMFVYLDNSCPAVVKAIADTALVRDEMIADGRCLRGPVLDGLRAADLANGRCDQKKPGKLKHAANLRGFAPFQSS